MRLLPIPISGLGMRFFFSGELDSSVGDEYRPIRQIVETTLNNALSEESYGESLEEIAVIPIILGPRFIEGRKERRLIKHQEKAADYRLFIDHSAFLNGSKNDRTRLLIENLLTCIEDMARKCKGRFDGQRLTNDIQKLFPELFADR